MLGFFKKTPHTPIKHIKPVATIYYNGNTYYTLDNKGLYIVNGADKMAVLKHTKEQGFSINTKSLRAREA